MNNTLQQPSGGIVKEGLLYKRGTENQSFTFVVHVT